MEGLIYAAIILVLYFLPTFMAVSGRKASVFVINLFTGWTLLGWCVALYMAVRSRESVKGAT